MQQNFLTKLAEKIGLVVFGGTVNIEKLHIVGQELTNKGERYRQIVLNKVNNYWLKGVLEKSLYEQVIIELGIEQQLKAVAFPWNLHWETGDELQQPLPQGTKIIDIFDSIGAGRTLLILGAPGSGKTIALLELTRNLIARAQQDVNHLIPVVFNLSSWKGEKRQAISEWIVEELKTKYHIPKEFGEIWVKEHQLLLLLDGLDEVKTKYQGACINALNRFLQDYGPEIVVCSRTEDYKSLSERLALQSAICIQPLTTDQINQYLDRLGSQLKALKNVLQEDNNLREFVKVPLILNVMVLAYQDRSVENLLQASSAKERQQCLFNTYIEWMFQRSRVSLKYPEIQVRQWISWLAETMSEASQTVFLIEQLQPSLLTRKETILYSFGLVITYLLFACLVSKLLGVANLVLIEGLILGAPVFWLISRGYNIYPIETLKWSWARFYKTLKRSVSFSIIFAVLAFVIFCLSIVFFSSSYHDHRLPVIPKESYEEWYPNSEFPAPSVPQGLAGITGLLTWLGSAILSGISILSFTFGIVNSLIQGITGPSIENKIIPNQGIFRSLKYSIFFSFISAILAIVIAGLIQFPVIFWGVFGLFFGFAAGGGAMCIKHLILRIILYLKGHIPWNYAQFLNYAVERAFLQRVGGGYIFSHRLLMEHFAQMKID